MTGKSSRRELQILGEDLLNGNHKACSDPMERYLSLQAATSAIQEVSRTTRILSEAVREQARSIRETARKEREDLQERVSNS